MSGPGLKNYIQSKSYLFFKLRSKLRGSRPDLRINAVNNSRENLKTDKSLPVILVYGYGNPGRQDDALGYLTAEWCSKMLDNGEFPNISVEFNYQLNIEDALLISEFNTVIFADASVEAIEDYTFSKIYPDKSIAFSTHSMSPWSVLALCSGLYSRVPEAYMLSIKGYEWDLGENLSPGAGKNLDKAITYLDSVLKQKFSGTG